MGFSFKRALGAVATGGLSELGGSSFDGQSAVLSGIPFVGQGFAAQQQQQFAAGQSAQQMAFQERMANTAHQRQVTDLKAAGLNPILSANSGAAVPTGAAAQGSSGSGAESSARMMDTLMRKEAEKADSVIDLQEAQAKAATKNAELLSNSASKVDKEAKLLDAQLPGALNEKKFQEEAGYYFKYLNNLRGIFKGVGGSSAKSKTREPIKMPPKKESGYRKRTQTYDGKGNYRGHKTEQFEKTYDNSTMY